MAASLTTDRTNTDRLTVLLDECRRMEIPGAAAGRQRERRQLRPQRRRGIRFGLAAVKNVGAAAAGSIVDGRDEHGPSKDLYEFCERLDLGAVNRRVVESLIAAGACDSLGGHRAQQLEVLERAMRNAQSVQDERRRGPDQPIRRRTRRRRWSSSRRCRTWPSGPRRSGSPMRRSCSGSTSPAIPSSRYEKDLAYFATSLLEIDGRQDGETVRVGGLVSRVSPIERPQGEGDGLRHPRGPIGQGGGRVLLRRLRQMQGTWWCRTRWSSSRAASTAATEP